MRPAFRLLVAAVLLVGTARAQAIDPATAELLFAEGRRAMAAEDYDTACAKFAESQRLDPGAGTLINLAECLDKSGQLAESWQAWKEARRLLRPGDDRQWAVEHRIEEVEKRLPRLELRLESTVPADAVVLRDAVQLGRPALGLPLPVNPGKHVVIVRAPGRDDRTYEIELAEAETEQLVLEAGPPKAPAAGSPAARAVPPRDAAASESDEGSSSLGTAGWVVGSVGVAALATGAVFGGLALGKKGDMDDACRTVDGETRCTPAGLDAADDGKTFALVANVGFALGAVGLGVGGYLLYLAGAEDAERSTAVSATPTPGGARLDVRGAF